MAPDRGDVPADLEPARAQPDAPRPRASADAAGGGRGPAGGDLQRRAPRPVRDPARGPARHPREPATVLLANPYFVPDQGVLRALQSAARRGVDVRLLVPLASDSRLLDFATRAIFPQLLAAAARIFRSPVVTHTKALMVDDTFVSIGSYNFDHRSLAYNLELVVNVIDPATAIEVGTMLISDMAASEELTATAFARRGWLVRLHRTDRLRPSPLALGQLGQGVFFLGGFFAAGGLAAGLAALAGAGSAGLGVLLPRLRAPSRPRPCAARGPSHCRRDRRTGQSRRHQRTGGSAPGSVHRPPRPRSAWTRGRRRADRRPARATGPDRRGTSRRWARCRRPASCSSPRRSAPSASRTASRRTRRSARSWRS